MSVHVLSLKSFWDVHREVLAGLSGGAGNRLALACLARVETAYEEKHPVRPRGGVRHVELQAVWTAHSSQ